MTEERRPPKPDVVVEEVSDLIRITAGSDHWKIQIRPYGIKGELGDWYTTGGFYRTRAGLRQSLTERLRYDATTKVPDIVAAIDRYVSAGLAAIAELPEYYPEGKGTGK